MSVSTPLDGVASSPSPLVSLSYLSPQRGFGLVATAPIAAGEVLFTESPRAAFQPNRPLVPTCCRDTCMRVIGSVESLVELGHRVFAQATGNDVTPAPGDRQTKQSLLQRIMTGLVPDDKIVACRSAASCAHVYCSAACERASWESGHALLCVGRHPQMADFLTSRNVVRNPDAQIASRILAGFVSSVQACSPAATAAQTHALWVSASTFHTLPWSTVLATQAIGAQEEIAMEAIDAHIREIKAKDDAAIVAAGCTLASAPASATDAPPALSASAAAQVDALNSTQAQYRAALSEGFSSFRGSLESGSAGDATRDFWLPYVSLEHFDRLAGANRLNCSLTQTTLPIPVIEEPNVTPALAITPDTPSEPLNLLTATADSVAESATAEPKVPFLIASLVSLFSPMSLPLANAKGLFAWHSKMNHSCSANARVENPREHSTIAWTARSMALVQELEATRRQEAEARSHGNKKKKQKNKKIADAQAQKAAQREKEEIEALQKIAAQIEREAATAAANSATGAVDAAAALPDDATCTIVVRATRALAAGEEVCINYLPTTADFRRTEVRQDYLRRHYLFECQCTRCVPTETTA